MSSLSSVCADHEPAASTTRRLALAERVSTRTRMRHAISVVSNGDNYESFSSQPVYMCVCVCVATVHLTASDGF